MVEHLRISQHEETSPTHVVLPGFRLRYAYGRSADTRSAHEPGQDYVVAAHDGRTAVFALCDGVSQSFYGDLAARCLGEDLVTWLLDIDSAASLTDVGQSLEVRLTGLCRRATQEIRSQPLPDLPPMVLQVLEEKRGMGSESTFVGVRAERHDDGMGLLVVWMGDSRLRLFDGENESTRLRADLFLTAQRWSSRRGAVNGVPNVWSETPTSCTAVVAYSDGLAALDGLARRPTDAELQDTMEQAWRSPTSDDMSFVELEVSA